MLEIDTPGHTSIVHNSHPEFVACFEASPWTSYANGISGHFLAYAINYSLFAEPPAGQLRLTEQPVVDFTKKLFEAAIKHTPGKYFSTGGDEINVRCYAEDPIVQASLNSTGQTLSQALETFTNKTHQVLVDNGKIPVVWEEMVLDHGDLGLSNNTVVLCVHVIPR
jgi:hexosaminidase